MFETAQWLLASDAAASLAQMAVRAATGSPELFALVRQRQDLVNCRRRTSCSPLQIATAQPADRQMLLRRSLSDGLGTIATRLDALNEQLSKDFPNYATPARPLPLSVEEVQAQLRADEAFVLFLVAVLCCK